jgi:hypothetical protein
MIEAFQDLERSDIHDADRNKEIQIIQLESILCGRLAKDTKYKNTMEKIREPAVDIPRFRKTFYPNVSKQVWDEMLEHATNETWTSHPALRNLLIKEMIQDELHQSRMLSLPRRVSMSRRASMSRRVSLSRLDSISNVNRVSEYDIIMPNLLLRRREEW